MRLLLLSCLSIGTFAQYCEPDWIQFNGYCYQYHNNRREAKAINYIRRICSKEGSELAPGENVAEIAFLSGESREIVWSDNLSRLFSGNASLSECVLSLYNPFCTSVLLNFVMVSVFLSLSTYPTLLSLGQSSSLHFSPGPHVSNRSTLPSTCPTVTLATGFEARDEKEARREGDGRKKKARNGSS